MATKAKLVKVKATVPVKDPDTTSQRCWGVVFKVDGDGLVAELPKDEADAMIEAGRAEKA